MDKSDRVVKENRGAPRGEPSGHQPANAKPVQASEPAPKLHEQVRHSEFDASHLSKDEGGRSTRFGQGGPGDRRGTSGSSDQQADAQGNIHKPVTPQGSKKRR